MEIPYTIEARPDTGLYNGKLALWLFLASEVILFGALFSSYIVLRSGAFEWPVGSEILSIPVGTINTLVLISSSITMIMAWVSLLRKDFVKYKRYLGLTIMLGVIFLFIKVYFEYVPKFSHHMYLSTSIYLALYFTMTGIHFLHVLGGVLVNSYFWGPGSKMWESEPKRFTNRIELAGLYWHFVDIVWLFLFPTLYLT